MPSSLPSRVVVALSALALAAEAQVATFQYPAGNYSVATNWSTGAIPRTNDIARIAITNIQTVTHTGGTFSAGALQLGSGLATGTLTVSAGTLTYGANSVIGSNGAVANLLIAGGSVVLTGAVDLGISTNADTAAAITNNAGTLTVDGELNVARQNGTGISRSTLTVNGGTVVVSSNIVTANGNGETRINLNGGVLETRGVRHLGSAAAREIRFNGGTLRANTNNAAFLPVAANAVALSNLVLNGGAILDSQGFTITAANPFRAGPGSTGGLVKTGSGLLELTSSASYTGATRIAAGTLRLSGAGSLYTTGAIPGTIEVESGGTLLLARSDAFGNHASTPLLSVVVSTNGAVQNTNTFNSLRGLTLRGGELRALGGASTNFGAYQLKGTVTVAGASASRIVAPSTINNFGTIQVGNNNAGGQTVFDVADTADANDLSVEASLVDGRNAGSTAFVPSGFIKTGPGVMRLESNNTLSGVASVNNGTLSIGPAALLRVSNIAIAAGAALDVADVGTYTVTNQAIGGAGTVRGSLLVGADGLLQPGGAGRPGTLTITGQLDVGSSSYTNVFDLTNRVTAGAGVNDLLAVGGSLGAGGSVIAVNPLAVPVSGSYRLIDYAGSLTSGFDPAVRGNVFRQTWTLSTTNAGAVDLIVSDVTNVLLSWSGNASGDWDAGSLNWTNLATGLDDRFYTADAVLFDDTGLDAPTVNIATQVRPASVTVDTTGSYAFVGDNRIADPPGAAATLTKTGPGKLVVHNTNDYSGGTVVSGGVLQVGAGLSSGAFGPGTIRVAAGGTLVYHRIDSPYTIAQALAGDGTIQFLGTGVSTQSGYGFSGVNTGFVGTMIVSNGARIALDNANDLGNAALIQIKDGGGLFQSAGTFGRPVEIAGLGWTEGSGRLGAMRVEGTTVWNAPVTLTADARIGAFGANGTISGTIAGPYELELWAGATARSMTLSPTGQNTYAAMRISSNMIVVAGTAGAFSSAPLIMNGGTQRLNGFSFSLSNLSSTVNGGTIVNHHATTPATLTVGLDDSSTVYGGVFANSGVAALHVTKVGAGTLTLNGANVNSGVFTVQVGTLALGASGSIASSGSVTLAGGTFDTTAKGVYAPTHAIRGNGTLNGAQLFNPGASLVPGTAGTAGTIAILGDVGMTAGFTNLFDLSADPLAVGGGTNDLVAVTGGLDPANSVVAINMLTNPLPTGTYTLFTYTGAKTSSFNTNVIGNASRRTWTLDEATPNAIKLIVAGDTPTSLRWLPQASAVWDAGTTNWFNLTGLVTDRFYIADSVLFDDAGLYSNAVTLTGTLLPAAITVDTTGEYSFAGSGRIQGATTFTKTGPGLLTLSNANDYAGAFYLSNGIVRAANSNVFGSGLGPTYISGGSLDLNGSILSNQGERFIVQGAGYNGTGTIFNSGASLNDGIRNLTLAGDATVAHWLPGGRWDLRGAGSQFNAEVDLAGYTLTKIGPGKVNLIDATITNAGNFRVEAGILEMSRSRVSGPGWISLAAGSTYFLENFTTGYVVKPLGADAATITNSGSTVTFGGTVTLTNGNVFATTTSLNLTNTVAGPGGFTKLGVGYLVLAASNSFAGPVTVNNNGGGPLALASASGPAMPVSVQLGHTNNGGGTAFLYTSNDNQFASGVSLSFGGSPNDWSWVKLFGTTQYLAAIVSDDNGGAVLDNVYQENGFNSDGQLVLTGPGDSYWSGSYLRDNGGGTSLGKLQIVQAGPGTVTLAGGRGNTTFSGGVIVSNGVLNLKSHYAAGRSTITLAGGTLAFDAPGLKEDIVSTATFSSATTNSLSSAVKLSPIRADSKADLGTNTMYIYSGYIVNTAAVPVTWTFAEQFDDRSYLAIDNTLVLNDAAVGNFSNPTLGTITLAPGLHAFDLRAHNGSGQGGATISGWWTNTMFAFGIDLQGRGTANQDFFQRMQDAGDGSFFLTDVQITNPVVLAADATVRVSSAIGPTNAINGPISGGATLTKTGAGALRLGNSNDYAGATVVAAGRLIVDGILAATPAVTVVSNTSLGGTGTISVASVAVAGGGTVGRFTTTSTGALTVANLTLDAGARVSTILTGTNPSLRVTGAFVTSASNPLRVLSDSAPALGTNTLIDYTGAIGGAGLAGLALQPLPNGAQGYLQDNPLDTTVELVITNAGLGIQWFGGVDNVWDVFGTVNWKTRLDGAPTVFNPSDSVLFDDTATTNATVNLALPVSPASVTVSNETKAYSLTLNGLSGAGGLLKQGAAQLAITNAALDYTGATVVAGGTLKLENLPRFAGGLLNQATVELASASGTWMLGTNRSIGGDGVFRKTGSGIVMLYNSVVAASNLIAVEEGMLRNGGNGSVWTANQADLDVAANAIFDMRADPVRFDVLTGNGTITNSFGNTAAETLTIGANNGSGVFGGTIQDSSRLLAGENNGSIALLKVGVGTQTLAAVSLAGGVTLDGGTLAITADSTVRGLLFGPAATSTNVAVLDLSAASLVVTGLTAQVSTSIPSVIVIGAGRTLTVNGTVTIGNNSGTNRFSSLTAYGAGSLLMTGPVYQVGAATGAVNFDTVTNDLSNLGTFVADLGIGGTFRVGNISGASPGVTSVPNTMLLASNSTIVANLIGLGDASGQGVLMGSLLLGAQSNTLYANTINIGLSGTQRSSGRMLFAGASGNLTVRGVSGGTSRANVNVLNHTSSTGTFTTGLLDLTGHPSDLLLGTLTIDSRLATNTVGDSGAVHFNSGTLDVTTVIVGRRASTSGTGTGSLNIGGGVVNIGTGGVALANSFTAGGTSIGQLNLTGGVVTVSGRIYRVGGLGTSVASLNLDGALLDMQGNVIGGPALTNAITNLVLASGTLANVAEINSGAPWAKTTTGTLVIAGSNAFSGAGSLSNGTLLVNGTLNGGGLTTAAGTTLGGTGFVAGTVQIAGVVAPGTSAGRLSIGLDCILGSTATQVVELGGTTAGLTHDQLAVGNFASVGGGALEVQLIDGHTPVAGNVYTVLVAATVSGPFAATSLPALGGGLGWDVQYPGGAVVLAVTGGVTLTGYDLAATAITNGQSGYNDDADGDGYANLLEYVTGGSLTNPGSQAQMNAARTNGMLALKFSRDTTATDATLYVEGSFAAANGAVWTPVATNSAGSWGGATNVNESGASPVSVTVQDTISPATNRFLRLRVSRP